MKAMVLRAPSDLVLDEVARPQPGPGQVLVHITHSGVCGTDYKIYNGSIRVPYPLIPGHEMAGERVDTGDRVIVDPETYDGTCFYCQKLLLLPEGADQSLSQRHADRPRRQRRLREYLMCRRASVFKAADSIDDRHAPMIQVLTTCLHAQRQVETFPGDTVAVIGLGCNRSAARAARRRRAARGSSASRGSAEKRAMAEKLGADVTDPRR
jgi:threonine dehydrogenase-like Zn-dependent dehydrogenase